MGRKEGIAFKVPVVNFRQKEICSLTFREEGEGRCKAGSLQVMVMGRSGAAYLLSSAFSLQHNTRFMAESGWGGGGSLEETGRGMRL